ncbi:ABC transporter substrate-binding protein [Neopusillimonas aromaticivorans]|uniref:ABC transporter substrate-binding protein n=1 Tax=Neopusillimonas aromaticivorans TaxID=2979868 RepID=UPI003315F6E5
MKKSLLAFALAAVMPISAAVAQDTIKVGLIVGETGPGASLGIPYKSTFAIMPETLGGLKVDIVMLDDATDATLAVKQARKLVEQDKVDLIFGSGNVPTAIAVSEVTNEAKVPQIALTPTPLKPDTSPWTFSIPQPMNVMSVPVVKHMKANGVKTVGFIGFTDSWGELVINNFKNVPGNDIKVVAEERYARNDTSVAGQILKILAAKPDAVLVGGSGTPAALPHTELRKRGYKGPIYHNPAVINKDFLRVGGQAVEGAMPQQARLSWPSSLMTATPSKPWRLISPNVTKTSTAKAASVHSRPTPGMPTWLQIRRCVPRQKKPSPVPKSSVTPSAMPSSRARKWSVYTVSTP